MIGQIMRPDEFTDHRVVGQSEITKPALVPSLDQFAVGAMGAGSVERQTVMDRHLRPTTPICRSRRSEKDQSRADTDAMALVPASIPRFSCD
jgi:hypothetical protein